MDTEKLIAEEIQAERERLEDAFKSKIRGKIQAIAATQAQIVNLQQALAKAKEELREMKFEPLDESIYK
jgi:adenylosuccinate lyase